MPPAIGRPGLVSTRMSEPLAAFIKLHIARDRLIDWLARTVLPASRWGDWREIGGQYYFTGGVRDIADVPAAELARSVDEADGELRRYATYRDGLGAILGSAEEPYMHRLQWRAEASELVAGSLTYSENLTDYLVFYAIARGVEAVLGPDDRGIAVLHNYLWGSPGDRVAHSALRMGPGATSSFLAPADVTSAGGIVEAIGLEMIPPDASQPPAPIDDLDQLQ